MRFEEEGAEEEVLIVGEHEGGRGDDQWGEAEKGQWIEKSATRHIQGRIGWGENRTRTPYHDETLQSSQGCMMRSCKRVVYLQQRASDLRNLGLGEV